MSARHHSRGRNTHWSDGRPAGFQTKPADFRPPYRMSRGTFVCVAIALGTAAYFAGQILWRGWGGV